MGKKAKKNVKKKVAEKRAAEKRSSAAKSQKKKEQPVKVEAVEAKKEKEEAYVPTTTNVLASETLEGVKDSLVGASEFLFTKHREASIIVITVLLCVAIFFVWQHKANDTWQKESLLRLEKTLAVGFTTLAEDKQIEKLQAISDECSGTEAQALALEKMASIYYQRSIKAAKEDKKFHQQKEYLEKALYLYEKLNTPDHPKGVQLVAQKNMENIQKEIQLLVSPPQAGEKGVYHKPTKM